MSFELLRFVTLAECKKNLMDAENYGYILDLRKIKKGLPTKEETVQRHKDSYDFWMDLYVWKMLRGEGFHPPLWLIQPEWEQEKAYMEWIAYFSYAWQGAKQDGSGAFSH